MTPPRHQAVSLRCETTVRTAARIWVFVSSPPGLGFTSLRPSRKVTYCTSALPDLRFVAEEDLRSLIMRETYHAKDRAKSENFTPLIFALPRLLRPLPPFSSRCLITCNPARPGAAALAASADPQPVPAGCTTPGEARLHRDGRGHGPAGNKIIPEQNMKGGVWALALRWTMS